nr:immunoglobulin light chain junction region [Macaca mulatta]
DYYCQAWDSFSDHYMF